MINLGDIVKLTLLIYIILCAADAASREPPVLNWIPRSDWINVKTEFGAKGDGSTAILLPSRARSTRFRTLATLLALSTSLLALIRLPTL